MTRTAGLRWIPIWVGGVVLGGCGQGEEAVPRAPSSAFCDEAMARVDSFMRQARAAGGVPEARSGRSTVIVAGIGELSSGMNAFASSDYMSEQHQQFVNLMPLVSYDEGLEPRPRLAESWEVAEDGTSITFHLRRDVYWHDGEITDAHDVAFTYTRVTDPRTAFPNAGYWAQYEPGPEGVEVVDDFTVVIRMTPHAEFMDPWTAVAIMPEHLLGDVPPEELGGHPFGSQCPVGNGPFVFTEHSPDDRWVFEANPRFPEALGGRPKIDRLVYRVVPEATTLLIELLTENIDIYLAPTPDQAPQIVEAPALELRRFPSRNYNFVAWNSRRPQLRDRRVRRALTLAIDRRELVGALLGDNGRLANSGVPPFHWAFDSTVVDTPYDPVEARRLLDEAGWRDRDADGVRESADGVRLSIVVKYNTGNQLRKGVAEIMQAQLLEVGVEVVPRAVEWATLLGQLFDPSTRNFDGVVLSWATDFRLDETELFHSAAIEGPTALAGLRSAKVDRYLDTLGLVVDRTDARALWQEYERVLDAEHPYTYLYFPSRLVGVNRRLRDVTMDARGELVSVGAWRIDPATQSGRR
jgi:peptide/nickel transport system substrate-binding protein